MSDKLPEKKNKKKINTERFVKRAKELKEYFEEEMRYLRDKEFENESLLPGKSF